MNEAVNSFFGKKSAAVKFDKIGDGVDGVIVAIHDREPQTEFGSTKVIPGKEQVRIEVQTEERDPEKPGDTGIRTLYCKNQLAYSCGKAFEDAGVAGPEIDGKLSVHWTSTSAPSTPGLNGAKQYTVVYTPPNKGSGNGQAVAVADVPAPDGIDPVAWASMPADMKAKLASK